MAFNAAMRRKYRKGMIGYRKGKRAFKKGQRAYKKYAPYVQASYRMWKRWRRRN